VITQLQAFAGRHAELEKFKGSYSSIEDVGATLNVIRGQPGIGKTSLLEAFSAQITIDKNKPIVAMARCDSVARAKTPFHVLAQLLPKVLDSRNADKDVQQEQLIGQICRVSSGLLKGFAPDILNLVLPGSSKIVEETAKIINASKQDSTDEIIAELFENQDEQITKLASLIADVSKIRPIVLVVDDAHLADPMSINVLFRLLNKHSDARVMLLLGVRLSYNRVRVKEDTCALDELLSFNKTIDCNLDKLPEPERVTFVNDLLSLMPNTLGDDFRQQLFKLTDGHPLLMKELLFGLASNKSLICKPDGIWHAESNIAWQQAPLNIHDALVHRMKILAPAEQEILRVASAFDGEINSFIISEFLQHSNWDILRILTRTLTDELAIIRETRAFRIGDKMVVGFRFREPLFREYIYQTLGMGEKLYIHDAIASGYQSIFGDDVTQVSSELAWHLAMAGRAKESVAIYQDSAQRAVKVGALSEALIHIESGLNEIDNLDWSEEKDISELNLHLLKIRVLKAREGWSSSTLKHSNERAAELAQRCGKAIEIESVLLGQWSSSLTRSDLNLSYDTAQLILKNAEETNDLQSLIVGYSTISNSLFWLGQITQSFQFSEKALAIYSDDLGDEIVSRHGFDVIVIAEMFSVWSAFILGKYDRLHVLKEIVKKRVNNSHPFSAVISQMTLCWQSSHEGNIEQTIIEANSLKAIADKNEFVSYQGLADIFLGWAYGMSHDTRQEGLALLSKGEKVWHETSGAMTTTYRNILRSLIFFESRQYNSLQRNISKTKAFMCNTDERAYESLLLIIEGDMLSLRKQDAHNAIQAYKKSISIARARQEKTFEVLALLKLAKMFPSNDINETHVGLKNLVHELDGQHGIELINEAKEFLLQNDYSTTY